MSAAQPKSAEPSMEEILASIRRIISDDQAPKPAEAAPAAEAAAATATAPAAPASAPVAAAPVAARPAPVLVDDDEEVMDLGPPATARQKEPHFLTDDPIDNDLTFGDPAPAKEAAPVETKKADDFDALMAAAEFSPEPAPAPVAPPAEERLVSPATDRMVTTAFSSLANTILTNNARTIEDLMTDMMRPMIKNWLDDNLPGIVERLVKAEIERVARGGR